MFGILGSLTFSGIGNKQPGVRTSQILNYFNIESFTFQKQVAFIGLLAASLLVLKTIFSLYLTKKTLYFLSYRSAEISSTLTSKFLSQSLSGINSKSIQDTTYSLINGPSIITTGIIGGTISLLSDMSLLIILLAGLFVVDTLIAILTIILFSTVGFGLYFLLKNKVKKFGVLESQNSIKSAEKINEAISTFREIFVKNRISFYSAEIKKLRFTGAKLVADNSFYQGLSKYIIELVVIFGSITISAIQFSIHTAEHAIAVLGIFLAASTRIAPAVLRMQQGFLSLLQNIGSVTPTLNLISKLENVSIQTTFKEIVKFEHLNFKSNIIIEDLTLIYPSKNTPAVSSVSINIMEGSVISIVGPSGAGKTTLVDLILGVLNPTSGSIKISGYSPKDAISKWTGAIAYVPQEISIIDGTLAENVTMGYPGIIYSEKYIDKALKLSKLFDFVSKLPNGIHTQVGPRGTKLSGGQKQRLGIARALFTQPKLIILDEATSSLDAIMESDINESIQSMKGSTTIVIVAHRLSTVQNSDCIFYLDNGKLLACGNFTEVREKIPNFDKQAKLMGI